ncbi:hypothetical protein MTR67_031048 [Solanum verrucosum]|uniref:TFIIF beta subunit HTH domain-containing protein n=1 Tax=Solanum verrucosum TaxID=315347 RepID=A0AAF0U1Q5_SOLVR|nr:hypothetical protein MTR67_031048 [Solanum verrucosum]
MEEDHGNSNSSITVDTTKWDRSVWLMKCPLVVSKSWQSQAAASSSSSDSPQVAKVIVSVDPLRSDDSSALQVKLSFTSPKIFQPQKNKTNSVSITDPFGRFNHYTINLYLIVPIRVEHNPASQFTMEMGGNDVGNMPKSYSLNMFQDFVPMCVLSETGQGRVTMEGKVIDNDRGVNMRPMPGMIGMIASSSKNPVPPFRVIPRKKGRGPVQTKAFKRTIPQQSAAPQTFASRDFTQDKKKAVPVKGPEVKRTRRDRGELEDIMFKLFERQPNWTLKQLVQETDQPAQFLKEILNELCVYNKRGTNQGTYELKPEYKKSVEDTGAE